MWCIFHNGDGEKVSLPFNTVDEIFYHGVLYPLCESQTSTHPPQINHKYDPTPLDIDRTDLVSLRKYCEPYNYAKIFMELGLNSDEDCAIGSKSRGKDCRWYHMCIWNPEIDTFISKSIFEGSIWEPELIFLARTQIVGKPSGIFLDVGANIGQYSVLAAALGHIVFAIEPIPEHVDMIHRTAKLNGFQDRVHTFRNGASDYYSQVNINIHKTNKGGSTIDRINSTQDETKADSRFYDRVVIDLITIDDILPILDSSYPDKDIVFWKADIEGYEPRMFRGAPNFLANKKPAFILFEFLGKSFIRTQCDFKELLPAFQKLDYKIFTLNVGMISEWNEYKIKNFASDFPTQTMLNAYSTDFILEYSPNEEQITDN